MYNLFKSFLCIAVFASAVFAQNLTIALPTPGTTVTAGSNITVQLDKPASLTGSEEVSVVIGASPCLAGCPNITDVLGTILYSGPFYPQSKNSAGNVYQNFSVTVPSWSNGLIQLGVAHFYLLGAGRTSQLQFENTTINLAGAVGR